jgi:hypothetical protein
MMGCQCSAHITPAEQDNDKGKQQEEPLANAETPHDGPASPEFDTSQTRALWKVLFRARGKVIKEAAMNPEVVEVYAARGFKASFSFHRVNHFVLTKGGNDRDMSHTNTKIRQNHWL